MPNYAFNNVLNNQFTRKWGGTTFTVDPYISGYFFTYWAKIPPQLVNVMLDSNNSSGSSQFHSISSEADIRQILAGSCLAVTIPGGVLNKAEFMGLGGGRWAVPSNVEFDNVCSFRFLEFSTLPILDIIHSWVRLIRDYRFGVTETLLRTSAKSSNSYHKENYTGACYYWTTAPDGRSLEYYALLSGLFPQRDPAELFSSDITAYDKIEIDIDFNCDYIWHEPWVRDKIEGLKENIIRSKDAIREYDRV